MTTAVLSVPGAVRVRALPWATVEMLAAMFRKLSHDLTNSLVGSVSLLELAKQRNQDADVAWDLERLGNHIMRPKATMQRTLLALPIPSGERPRDHDALLRHVHEVAGREGVDVRWQLDARRDLPPTLSDAEWVHVLQVLTQNSLEAFEAARLDGDELDPIPWLEVTAERRAGVVQVAVRDNGPGCARLAAAAAGELRRGGGGHLGLGLSVAAAILEKAGGALYLAPVEPHGVQAVLVAPASRS